MVEREEYVRRATIMLRYFDHEVPVLWKVDCVQRNKGNPDLFAPALPGQAVSLV